MNDKWIFGHQDIRDVNQMPEGAIGFIYRIFDENGKEYIGQKSLFSKRKKKFGKKKIAEITDKRKKKYEYIIKESNWLSYTGSNKELNEKIEDGLKYTKHILQFCFNKKQLTYFETKFLMLYGTIEPGNNSYNGNIQGRFYPKDLLND